MAQLRRDYEQFVARDAKVVVIGPEDPKAFRDYWQKENLPFVGLADPTHAVANHYGQEVSLLKLGRMPALMTMAMKRVKNILLKRYRSRNRTRIAAA